LKFIHSLPIPYRIGADCGHSVASIRLASNDYLCPGTILAKVAADVPTSVDSIRQRPKLIVGVPAHYARDNGRYRHRGRAAGLGTRVSTVTGIDCRRHGSMDSFVSSGKLQKSSNTDVPSSPDDQKEKGEDSQDHSSLYGGGTTDATIAEMTAGSSSSSGRGQQRLCVVVTEGDPTLEVTVRDAALLH
jgi:hypothetical protein